MIGEKKIVLVVLDGLGDRPIADFGGLTPLEAARAPNLNLLAERGECGLLDVIGVGIRPASDVGHLALFGYDPHCTYTGRGALEALGVGLPLPEGSVAFRANFATVDGQGKIIDRRAGRIDSCAEFEAALNKIKVPGVKAAFKAGVGHRGAVVLSPEKGSVLSPEVTDVDPHSAGKKIGKCAPSSKTQEAKFTADAVNAYVAAARKVLERHPVNQARRKQKLFQANGILLRGAGVVPKLASFKERYGVKSACIAGGALYKGVARAAGMDVINVHGATGKPDTDLKAKFDAAVAALSSGGHDFVFVHVKGTDVFGHDNDPAGKRAFIERVDRFIQPLLDLDNAIVAVTGDHSTPCECKDHSGDPVPIVIFGHGVRRDSIRKFGERECAKGSLGRIRGQSVMNELMNLAGRAPLYGD